MFKAMVASTFGNMIFDGDSQLGLQISFDALIYWDRICHGEGAVALANNFVLKTQTLSGQSLRFGTSLR